MRGNKANYANYEANRKLGKLGKWYLKYGDESHIWIEKMFH